MIVTVKDGYRIMIPREIRESMNIQLGDEMELTNIQNKVLVLSPVDVDHKVVNVSENETVDSSIYDNTSLTKDMGSLNTTGDEVEKLVEDVQLEGNDLEISESDKWHTGVTKDGIEISYRVAKLKDEVEHNKYLSNTLGCEKYYRRTFSRCGLVARTKLKYINDYCNECRGQLLENYEDVEDCICPYKDFDKEIKNERDKIDNSVDRENEVVEAINEPEVKELEVKEVSKNIREKINQLNIVSNKENTSERLENKILNVQLKEQEKMSEEEIQEINGAMRKKVQCVQYDNGSYNVCSSCEELNNKGYLIDGKFYCSKCFREDFMSFLNKYRKLREENIKC